MELLKVSMKEGIYRKYKLSKADGSELDERAKYFVIRYDKTADHDQQGIEALIAYCTSIMENKIEGLYPLFDDLILDIIGNCEWGTLLHSKACTLLSHMSEMRMIDKNI